MLHIIQNTFTIKKLIFLLNIKKLVKVLTELSRSCKESGLPVKQKAQKAQSSTTATDKKSAKKPDKKANNTTNNKADDKANKKVDNKANNKVGNKVNKEANNKTSSKSKTH